jgi:hypothetical protein
LATGSASACQTRIDEFGWGVKSLGNSQGEGLLEGNLAGKDLDAGGFVDQAGVIDRGSILTLLETIG